MRGYGKGRSYLNTESVVVSSIGGVQSLALNIVLPPAVVIGVGTEVQRTGDDVVAALSVALVVAARLHDVDLAGARPGAIYAVLGQHPDGRPQPVSSGQLGDDLNATVLDVGAELGVDATRLDRVDDGAVGSVGGSDAVSPVATGAAVTAEIDGVVVSKILLVLKSGLNVKLPVLDEDVLVRVRSHLELTVAANIVSHCEQGGTWQDIVKRSKPYSCNILKRGLKRW